MPLNHIALSVADREASAAFYARHFELAERVHEDDHLLILRAPDGALLALSDAEEVPRDLPRTHHFGFQVADPAQVRAARASFAAAGVEESEWQDDHGFVRVQVFDPDGYRVEVFAMS